MKINELKAGDILRCIDGGFDCIDADAIYGVQTDEKGDRYVECRETPRHYISGPVSPHDEYGELVGFEKVPK